MAPPTIDVQFPVTRRLKQDGGCGRMSIHQARRSTFWKLFPLGSQIDAFYWF
jgi:hypothetical protein